MMNESCLLYKLLNDYHGKLTPYKYNNIVSNFFSLDHGTKKQRSNYIQHSPRTADFNQDTSENLINNIDMLENLNQNVIQNEDYILNDTSSFSSNSISSIDTTINNDFNTKQNSILGNIFTTEQQCMIKLIKLLEDMNCPDSAVTKIIDWARTSYMSGFDFNPTSKTRYGNIQWMKKMVVNNNAFYPKIQSIPLINTSTVDIVSFDFVSQLLRIVQNPKLMTQNNLLLDIDNPTIMYTSPDNIISDALSGSAYKGVYMHEHHNHDSNRPLLVIPICLWGDATHIDSGSRFKLEPWSFTPLIFKETVRRNNRFWGMLGYVKHLKTTSAQKKP